MKITLTSAQVKEIQTKAQTVQNEAYNEYTRARDRYNKIVNILRAGEVELVTLIELTAGLPDGEAKTQPPSLLSDTSHYFAYSRTGRREGGALAVHRIAVTPEHIGGGKKRYNATCTCPAGRNHGYCWAADEAKVQAADPTRKSGTGGVWKQTV